MTGQDHGQKARGLHQEIGAMTITATAGPQTPVRHGEVLTPDHRGVDLIQVPHQVPHRDLTGLQVEEATAEGPHPGQEEGLREDETDAKTGSWIDPS